MPTDHQTDSFMSKSHETCRVAQLARYVPTERGHCAKGLMEINADPTFYQDLFKNNAVL